MEIVIACCGCHSLLPVDKQGRCDLCQTPIEKSRWKVNNTVRKSQFNIKKIHKKTIAKDKKLTKKTLKKIQLAGHQFNRKRYLNKQTLDTLKLQTELKIDDYINQNNQKLTDNVKQANQLTAIEVSRINKVIKNTKSNEALYKCSYEIETTETLEHKIRFTNSAKGNYPGIIGIDPDDECSKYVSDVTNDLVSLAFGLFSIATLYVNDGDMIIYGAAILAGMVCLLSMSPFINFMDSVTPSIESSSSTFIKLNLTHINVMRLLLILLMMYLFTTALI